MKPRTSLRTRRAVSSDFESRYYDAKAAVFLHLALQFFKNIADEFHNFTAAQEGPVYGTATRNGVRLLCPPQELRRFQRLSRWSQGYSSNIGTCL